MMRELQENTFFEKTTLYDALLILYPKISKYELELITTFLRYNRWLRVKEINQVTNIPRTKIYKVANDLVISGFLEEKTLKPKLPEQGNRKARARAMREQGFRPQGEARGFKVFRVNRKVILDRLTWVSACFKELQASLSKAKSK